MANPQGLRRADANRAIRKEAVREQISRQKHVQSIVKTIDKIEDMETDLDPMELNRLKIAMDARFRLVSKYLGDVKAIEVSEETTLSDMDDDELDDRIAEELAAIETEQG